MGYVMPIRPRRRPLRPRGEIHAGLAQANLELVVLFCSRSFDLDILGPEIGRLFENVTVVGCTTAGEITPIGYLEGSITGFSLSARRPTGPALICGSFHVARSCTPISICSSASCAT